MPATLVADWVTRIVKVLMGLQPWIADVRWACVLRAAVARGRVMVLPPGKCPDPAGDGEVDTPKKYYVCQKTACAGFADFDTGPATHGFDIKQPCFAAVLFKTESP